MKSINTIKELDIVLWVNIMLVGIVSLLFFYYITMANVVTAKSYRVQVLKEKLEVLAETNGALMAKKLALENSSLLIEFAKSRSLVEAKRVLYIFENNNVAQR